MTTTFHRICFTFLAALLPVGCASKQTLQPRQSFLTVPAAASAGDSTCPGLDRFIRGAGEKFALELAHSNDQFSNATWTWISDPSPVSGTALRKSFSELQIHRYDKAFWSSVLALDAVPESGESCEARRKMKRLRQLADRFYLPSEAAIQAEHTSFELATALRERTRQFLYRLPGEKDGLTKASFLLRLGQTADRGKRESLYKFFSSARSMKWSEWGYLDLVRTRNEEAKAVGLEDFVQYRLIRSGVSADTLSEVIRRVRNRLVPRAKDILTERGSRAGIAKPETWDFEYLKQRSALFDLNRVLKEIPHESIWGGVEDFFLSLGIDPKRFVSRRENAWAKGRDPTNHSLVLKTPLQASIAGVKVVSSYQGAVSFGGVQQVGFDEVRDMIRHLGRLAYTHGEVPSDPVFYSSEGHGVVLTGELFASLATSKRYVEKWLEKSASVLNPEEKSRVLSDWVKQARENLILEIVALAFLSELEVRIYTIQDKEISEQWAELFKEYYGVEASPFYSDWDHDEFLSSPFEHSLKLLSILSYVEWFEDLSRVTGEVALTPTLGQTIRQKLIQPGSAPDVEKLAATLSGKSVDFNRAIDRLRENSSN